MALDDGYIDPFLNAAEVLIHPLQQFDDAISLCDEVLEFAEANEERADALLLKIDAQLGKGDRDDARGSLKLLPEAELEGPVYPFLIGRAMYEVGDVERAEPHLIKAVETDPQNPDAHYYLGLVRDARKDFRLATLSFLEARELDFAMPAPSWSPSKEVFQQAVEKAIGKLTPEQLKAIERTIVLVAESPGMEVVADGVDPRAPVLLDGLAPEGEAGPVASRVFLYKRNLERLCGGIEQLEEEIAFQLGEEIKHVLGREKGDEPAAATDTSDESSTAT